MSNWDRIALLKLSDAIRTHMASADTAEALHALLHPILQQCDRGSKSVNTSSWLLHEVTHQLYELCKQQQEGDCICSGVGGHCGNCKLLRI